MHALRKGKTAGSDDISIAFPIVLAYLLVLPANGGATMARAGKTIVGALVGLFLLVVVVLVLLVSNLDRIVERAIETVGSRVAGVQVEVGSVNISLQEGRGSISDLSLGNPRGFERGKAIQLKTVALDLDVKNVSSELVRIESVLVDGARVNAIQGARGNNLQAILDNLRSDQPTDSGADAEPDTKLIIEDFQFRDGELTVTLPKMPARTGRIPDIHLTGIGEQSNGVTAAQAARQILEPIMQRSISTVSGISKEKLEGAARQQLDKALGEGAGDTLGKLLDRDKD